jgi:phosphoenolpyruvate carboxykinase (GTP)
LGLAKKSDESKLPKIFYVNWFRRGSDGRFLWPGFGENSRVLKWIIDRLDGRVEGIENAIGLSPNPADIDRGGLDLSLADLSEALAVRNDEWQGELPLIEEWFEKIGSKLPGELRSEFEGLRSRLS